MYTASKLSDMTTKLHSHIICCYRVPKLFTNKRKDKYATLYMIHNPHIN